jgi:hypothetical protein
MNHNSKSSVAIGENRSELTPIKSIPYAKQEAVAMQQQLAMAGAQGSTQKIPQIST